MQSTLSLLLLSSLLGCASNTTPDQADAENLSTPHEPNNGVQLGALDKTDISDVVSQDIHLVQQCYEDSLTLNPDLAGRIEVKIVIGSTGAVTKGEIKTSTVDSIDVEDCILDVMTDLQFPEPEGGGIVIVTYPFSLSR